MYLLPLWSLLLFSAFLVYWKKQLMLQLKGALTNPAVFLVLKHTGFTVQSGLVTEKAPHAPACRSQTRLTGLLGRHNSVYGKHSSVYTVSPRQI